MITENAWNESISVDDAGCAPIVYYYAGNALVNICYLFEAIVITSVYG